MATTSSNRGKTKQTKPIKTASAKSTAAKSRTAKASRSAASVKRSRFGLPALRVPSLLSVSIIVFFGLAVLAWLLMSDASYPITVTHLTSDVLLSQGAETAYITAHRPFYDVELRWVVVAVMLLSLIAPLLYLTRLRQYYSQSLAGRIVATRWLDLMVTTSIMIGTVSVLVGITDLITIKLITGFLVITCLLSWLAERNNARGSRPVWGSFAIGLVTGTIPWLAIGVTHIATLLYGMVRSPWYVYAVCFAVLIGFCLIGLNQLKAYRWKDGRSDYLQIERNYLLINLVTKGLFAVLLIIGLAK